MEFIITAVLMAGIVILSIAFLNAFSKVFKDSSKPMTNLEKHLFKEMFCHQKDKNLCASLFQQDS